MTAVASGPGFTGPRRHGPLAAAAVVLGAAVALRLASSSWPFYDLDVYLAGGQALLSGADLYAVEAHGLLFTYPPFAAVVFIPLTAAGPAAGWAITAASLVAYAVVMWAVARRLQLGGALVSIVGVGGLALEPVARTLFLGQVNLVLLGLVVVDLLVLPAKGRGLLVGLAAGIKLTPAVFVLYFLVKRDWASAARAAAAGTATVLVGWVVAPADSRTYWGGRVLSMESFGDFQVHSANQSVRSVLARALGRADVPIALWVGVAVIALITSALVAGRCAATGDDVGAMVAVAVGGLAVSPISWTHHWVWVVPAILYAVRRERTLVAWGLGLLTFVAPMWFLPAGEGVELRYAWWQVVVSATYLLAGAVGLALLARGGALERRAPRGRGLEPGES